MQGELLALHRCLECVLTDGTAAAQELMASEIASVTGEVHAHAHVVVSNSMRYHHLSVLLLMMMM